MIARQGYSPARCAARMDTVIVSIVVVIALAGHVALYRWVRFKIDEGIILQYLREHASSADPARHAADSIATQTGLAEDRIDQVCRRSRQLRAVADGWRAS